MDRHYAPARGYLQGPLSDATLTEPPSLRSPFASRLRASSLSPFRPSARPCGEPLSLESRAVAPDQVGLGPSQYPRSAWRAASGRAGAWGASPWREYAIAARRTCIMQALKLRHYRPSRSCNPREPDSPGAAGTSRRRARGRRPPSRCRARFRSLCRRGGRRSEEHTSELQSPCNLVCRLLLEKKKDTGCAYMILSTRHDAATI